jgi:DNA-binding response OmpR family regulator
LKAPWQHRSATVTAGQLVVMNKKCILVVDDDRAILRTFSRILRNCGYEIETAESGGEAISKAKSRHFDMVLLDLRLPDMNGTDILIRARDPLRSTAKIIITGFPSLESGVTALDEGADAYLTKPVAPQELLTLVDDKLGHPEFCSPDGGLSE